jgi:hypothetical protein
MSFQLGTLNYWLRKVGLVLTLIVDVNRVLPTILRFEKASSYDARLVE